jgi:uncharacterized protein (DUF488 family)
MEAVEFKNQIDRLLLAAQEKNTALMCAEASWHHCHRSLVADFLTSKGKTIIHIIDVNKTEPHTYTSAARITEGSLSYAAKPEAQQQLF